jgi:hypothetical protein
MREPVPERLWLTSLTTNPLKKGSTGMKLQLEMMEFGVSGLAEVRTLVKRWQQLVAGLAKEEGPALAWQTHRQVGVEVEDRRPGAEVLLTFLAPKLVLERCLADLRHQGLEVIEEPLVPGVVLTCRLGSRNPQ